MAGLAGSWCDGALVALDLETTDVEPHRDRIVTASVVAITPRIVGRPEVSARTWLANPGVDIPADATEIHGVSNEQARREGRPPAEVVMELVEHLAERWTASVPLCVFNAAFDLTMLDAELRRHHRRSLPLSGPVVDPQVIDRHLDPRRTGRRTLRDVCEHYQVRLDRAHDGVQDALAAARPCRCGAAAPTRRRCARRGKSVASVA
jgi:DNA polymerase-3 subunit epsilon